MQTEWPLATRTIAGQRLRYVDVGTGDPVLLLHGYPQSHRAWRHQIGPLSRTRRVIAPDWFGWAGLARVVCPTTIVWGTADRYCPTSTAEDLARRIPGAAYRPLSGVDHFVMEERPDAVTAHLEELLARPLRRHLAAVAE